MKHKNCSFFTSNKGFTLLEILMVIILIGIVAATAVMFIGNILEQQSVDLTLKDMQNLNHAIVGNPDLVEGGVRNSFGYTGDMGALPANLTALILQGGQLGWRADTGFGGLTNLGTGAGWRGPYVEDKQDDSGTYLALLDGWGRLYSYDAATGRVGSAGSNGVFGGFAAPDADDIIYPQTSVGTILGTVSGRVTNPNGGSIQAPPATNNVTIYAPPPVGAVNLTTYTGATDANGYYTITNVPIGKHKLSVTVGGTTADRAVTALPSATTNMDIVFSTAMTTPDITDVTSFTATPISTSTIRLDWSPPVTTNTDNSAIWDLKGYNIYKGLAVNPTSLYAFLPNTQTSGTVSYIDSNATYFNTYNYRITAVNTSGIESNYSANVSTLGVYGSASIFQTSGASIWNTSCIQFQVKNYSSANIAVANNTVTWSGGPGGYKIAVSTAGQPACPATGAAGCTASGVSVNNAYTLNANGGNIGYITVSFFTNSNNCNNTQAINASNNPYLGFNNNAYIIGDTNNGLR